MNSSSTISEDPHSHAKSHPLVAHDLSFLNLSPLIPPSAPLDSVSKHQATLSFGGGANRSESKGGYLTLLKQICLAKYFGHNTRSVGRSTLDKPATHCYYLRALWISSPFLNPVEYGVKQIQWGKRKSPCLPVFHPSVQTKWAMSEKLEKNMS